MSIARFEDSIAWQKAKQLCVEVFKIFESHKDFSFRDQIQRAAVSVMNNIAEGFERKGNKEFAYFLFVAKGSCGDFVQCSFSPRNSIKFLRKHNRP
ncbi:MAG: four helix bundle protein [Bacteroidia bacterium]